MCTLPKRHLNNYLALNTLKYKLFKRHLNILLSWVHNYMKNPKNNSKNNWEKYTPLAKKDKKVGFAILFYI